MFKRKGIALITVLLAAVVLAMLSTAMICLNRNGLLSLGQYEQRTRALQACYAGLDYGRARLLQDPGWGKTAFLASHAVLDKPETVVLESGATQAQNIAEGTLPLDDSKFQVRVENNLSNKFSLPAPDWSRSGVMVPPRCVFVAVDGESGGSRRHIEVVLCRNVGVGVGIFAGKDLGITLANGAADKALIFSSTLPRGNHVNVNENVLLPATSKIDFGTLAARGRLQSGIDTKVGSSFDFKPDGSIDSNSVSGTSLAGDPNAANQAGQEMKTSIHTSSPPSPPRFKPDQLKQPSSPADLAPGTYKFIDQETVQFTPPSGSGATTYRGSISLSGGKSVRLGEYRFMPEGDIKVNGDLILVGEQTKLSVANGRMVGGDTTPMPVSLAVGYGAKGLPLGTDQMGTDTITKTRLTVSGNITIKGDMVGSGQLFVEKNSNGGGSLTVEGNSRLSATRTDGMAVVAEDSVNFRDVNNMAPVQPFAMGTKDFDLYGPALQFSGNPPYSTDQKTIINNWQGQPGVNITSVVGEDDNPGATLRGRPISDYGRVLDAILAEGNTAADLAGAQVVVTQGPPDAPTDVILTGRELVNQYVQEVQNNHGGMTLGRATRVREFIKSVERGAPNPALLSIWYPDSQVAGLNSAGLSDTNYKAYDTTILTLVANQVSAYNQDARLKGLTLLQFMNAPNGYNNSQRFDFIFGGILYAQKNIYAHLANRFNLLGSMISAEGTVGFDHLSGGQVVYDPNSFEDQFDLTKVGLTPNFFWMAP